MKKFSLSVFAFSLASGVVLPSMAQTSKFEGWAGTASLGYQSIKPKFDNVVDDNNPPRTFTVTSSSGTGLVGKVGVEYTWALDSKYVVSAALDYGLNYGGKSDVTFSRVGFSGSEQMKTKQNAGISIAPGVLLNNNTLGYVKLGYVAVSSRSESDGSTDSGNAYTYGVGAKFLQPNNYFIYTGLDYLAGKKKSFTGELSGEASTSGFALSVGVGKRF